MKRWLIIFPLCWLVTGEVVRVKDGDTFVADLHIWARLVARETIRVDGVDTWEKRHPKGEAATTFTTRWLSRGNFQFYTCGKYSFNRIVGQVFREGSNLATELKNNGHEKTE